MPDRSGVPITRGKKVEREASVGHEAGRSRRAPGRDALPGQRAAGIVWSDFALLEDAGLGSYEKRALVTLAVHGVADAATLCRDGDIPTSKIYAAMESLGRDGLVDIRRSRPRLYQALPADLLVDRLAAQVRERAEQAVRRIDGLRDALARLPHRLAGGERRADMALGSQSHVKRHVSRLAAARRRVLSYLEPGDLRAIEQVRETGFDVLRLIAGSRRRTGFEHRVMIGFGRRDGAAVRRFLRAHADVLPEPAELRYCAEIGHPFHLIDEEQVVLAVDHPFAGDGRLASLLVHDQGLAGQLAGGFEALWARALPDLAQIRAWPTSGPRGD